MFYEQQEASKGVLDSSCNVQSMGFLKEISSGDSTVKQLGKRE